MQSHLRLLLLLLFSSLPAAAQDGHWTLEAVLSWEGNADYGLTLATPSGHVEPDESAEGFTHGGDVNCATGGIGPETISGTGGGQGRYYFEGFWWRNCPGGIPPSGAALTAKITAHRPLTINGQSFAPGAVFERTVYPDDAGDLIIDLRVQFAGADPSVDLDIDSDNTDDVDHVPSRNSEEEEVEDAADEMGVVPDDKPGKVMVLNDGDVDYDGVPDYVDGYNFQDGVDEDDVCIGAKFAKLVATVVASDWQNGKVKFNYADSDPSAVTSTADDPYALPPGRIRIWRKDGGEQRNMQAVEEGGDWIKANVEYTLSELGFSQGEATQVFMSKLSSSAKKSVTS